MAENKFAEILGTLRRESNKTQGELAESLGLSSSYIAMLESGDRGNKNPLTHDQVRVLIEKMEIFPPKSDELLEAAGLSTFRTEKDELRIQKDYPDLKEVWIFAKVIRDVDEDWYEVVKKNIMRGVKYNYFTTSQTKCRKLYNRLKREEVSINLNQNLECFIFPEKLFMANFAIYNPSEKNRYCCGAVFEDGKATSFYTLEKTEGELLYLILDEWKTSILENDFIRLGDAYKVPLDDLNEKPQIKYVSSFTQELGK